MSSSRIAIAWLTMPGIRFASASSIRCPSVWPSGTAFTAAITWFSSHDQRYACSASCASICHALTAAANAAGNDGSSNSERLNVKARQKTVQRITHLHGLGSQLGSLAICEEQQVQCFDVVRVADHAKEQRRFHARHRELEQIANPLLGARRHRDNAGIDRRFETLRIAVGAHRQRRACELQQAHEISVRGHGRNGRDRACDAS